MKILESYKPYNNWKHSKFDAWQKDLQGWGLYFWRLVVTIITDSKFLWTSKAPHRRVHTVKRGFWLASARCKNTVLAREVYKTISYTLSKICINWIYDIIYDVIYYVIYHIIYDMIYLGWVNRIRKPNLQNGQFIEIECNRIRMAKNRNEKSEKPCGKTT